MKIEATPMADQMPIRPLFILGNPRTGSTLLSTLLLQHPSIHVHGELFHSVENERKESHKLRGRRKAWFDPEVDDAILFLDEHVFGVSTDYQDTEVSIVGVKIFADHVSEGGASHLFRRIRGHYPQAEIIHMRRDDYLDVLISHEFASRSGNGSAGLTTQKLEMRYLHLRLTWKMHEIFGKECIALTHSLH